MSAPAQDPTTPFGVTEAIDAVRAAGDGIDDARLAKVARRNRAARPDVVAVLADLRDGSPEAMAAREAFGLLDVSAATLTASIRWHRSRARQAERERERAADDRPVVRTGPDLHIDSADSIAALARDPDLYVRDGQLVRVVNVSPVNPHAVKPHSVGTLRSRLAACIRFERVGRSGEWEKCLPPDPVVSDVLDFGEYDGIRRLEGIVDAPTMRPDGTVLQDPGYDPATCLLYVPAREYPRVPDAPTQDQCAEALRRLWVETSYDFPYRKLGYADPAALESDPDGVHRFIAAKSCPDAWGVPVAVCTILARPAILGDCPAIAFDSAGPGTGKTKQADVACIITTGRPAQKTTWPKRVEGGETEAEVSKRLDAKVLTRPRVIVWDEVRGPFGGEALNNAITCKGVLPVRPLGTSTDVVVPYHAVMLAAGSNITPKDNFHRRCVVPRIESPDPDPEKHAGWRRPDLEASVLELQPQLAVGALTIMVGYMAAGSPDMGIPAWGGFEAWTMVARAIVWAGGGNIMMCRPTEDPDARNEERDMAAAVVDAIARLEPKREDGYPTGAGYTLSDLINVLYSKERLRGELSAQDANDGFDAAREAIDAITKNSPGRKPSARVLGAELGGWKTRNVGGKAIVRAGKAHGNVTKWTAVTFGAPPAPILAPTPIASAPEPDPVPETDEERLAREAEAERLNCG